MQKDAVRAINDLFEEGTFALSDRIVGLVDEGLEPEAMDDDEARAVREMESHKVRYR